MLLRLFSLTKVVLLVFFLNGCASQNAFINKLPAEEVQKIKQLYSKEIAAIENMRDELPQVFSDEEYRKEWLNRKRQELDSYSFYYLSVDNGRIGFTVINRRPEGYFGASYSGASHCERDLLVGRGELRLRSGNIPIYFCQIIRPYYVTAEFRGEREIKSLFPTISEENNEIQMRHYSFSIPAASGWQVQSFDEYTQTMAIIIKKDRTIFQIKLIKNPILNEDMRAKSAEVVADDFRNHEKQGMIELGVKEGLYQLKDVTMGKEIIRGKSFYKMDYVTFTELGTESASLYLYFPKEKNNEYFIVAHYSEARLGNKLSVKSHRPDFISILESLEVR